MWFPRRCVYSVTCCWAKTAGAERHRSPASGRIAWRTGKQGGFRQRPTFRSRGHGFGKCKTPHWAAIRNCPDQGLAPKAPIPVRFQHIALRDGDRCDTCRHSLQNPAFCPALPTLGSAAQNGPADGWPHRSETGADRRCPCRFRKSHRSGRQTGHYDRTGRLRWRARPDMPPTARPARASAVDIPTDILLREQGACAVHAVISVVYQEPQFGCIFQPGLLADDAP